MWRALVKGAALAAFGHALGGPRLYRELTRAVLGTQATHVDKLRRVWPGYLAAWRDRAGLGAGAATTTATGHGTAPASPGRGTGATTTAAATTADTTTTNTTTANTTTAATTGRGFEGLDVWIHEGGWTPYPLLVNYLVTGRGGVVTDGEGRVLDRYLARAVGGALTTDFAAAGVAIPDDRRRVVEGLRWSPSAAAAIAAVGGAVHTGVDPAAIPLASASIDLCHSGGALEHLAPAALDAFLAECHRVLRPGAVASHVFDHRDHLHHADRRLPFLAHLAVPDVLYRPLFGHPLGYHNRLLPGEVMARFEAAGFERIAVRRMLLPDRRYVDDGDDAIASASRPGLPRALLAPRFRAASDADLRTAAAHYLYRKPRR